MADSPEEKGTKKRNPLIRYISGFLVSFALIFAGMYFYMTRLVIPRMEEQTALLDPQDGVVDSVDVIPSIDADSSLATSEPERILEEEQPDIPEIQDGTQELAAEEEEEQRQARVRRLAKIYAAMKAQEAAASVVKLDNETITELLLQMKDRDAGKLLAALSALQPDRTAQVIQQMIQ